MPMREPGPLSRRPAAEDDPPAVPAPSSGAEASSAAAPLLPRGPRPGGGAHPRAAARAHRAARPDDVDGLLGRIRELVRARDRLRHERPQDARIAARSAEIERLQQRLAEAVRHELARMQATSPV
jgi:hypothetical protein